MNEYNDVCHEMPDGVQQRRPEQSADQFSNLANRAADSELQTALSELEVLPFKDENQKAVFFENVQRLHGRHITQIFKLGVIPLQISTTEPSHLLEEAVKLFDICLSYCYTSDVSKRVAFEYYAKALKFCFPSQSTNCLSTSVVSKLLQLVQIVQEGKLASIFGGKPEEMTNMQINEPTKHFISELLATFETRRDEGYLAEIIDHTVTFASKEATISSVEELLVGALRSEHVLRDWINLLKFANVSSRFASTLAKMGGVRCRVHVPVLGVVVHESTVCYFVTILEQMKRSGSVVSLPSDEERLRIFFNHVNHFCYNPTMTAISIKLLATTSISNEVLVEVLEHLCCKEKRPSQHFDQSFAEGFEVVSKFLSLFPDGDLLNKVLKFYKETVPVDQGCQALSRLMVLFMERTISECVCFQERAQKIFNFLDSLDRPLLRSINVWYRLLVWFIKEFPASFCKERRPEVLFFIRKAAIPQHVPDEERPAYDRLSNALQQFLEWVSQQSRTEEMKREMIWLLMSCANKASFLYNFEFSMFVTKRLSLSEQLQFSTKKSVAQDITRLGEVFKERERSVLREVVEGVTSNHTLELKDKIFSEIIHFVKRCSDAKIIPADILQLLSLVSNTPLSGDRRVKLLQTSKKSGKGLRCGLYILQLIKSHYHFLIQGANEYFDVMFSAFVDVLKEDQDLCQQFYDQQSPRFSSAQVQDVWSFEVARLISLGLFKEEIDRKWCLPVLEQAGQLSSPSEMLQLYSQVRTSAVKVVDLLRNRSEMHSSPDGSGRRQIPDCAVPQTFVSSLSVIVRSNVLPAQEKLLLVKKVCDIFVQCPDSLTKQPMENALRNLIPFSRDNDDVMCLEFNQMEAILDHPTIMTQLSRLPVDMAKSLCSVFSTKISGYFSREKLVDIYYFIGSLEHLDEVFFSNFVPILEVAIHESSSLEGAVEIVEELVDIVRAVPSERISFIMENFGYLVGHQVNKQDRGQFLSEVAMKWDFSPNSRALSYLEIPRLLWKVYTTTNTSTERCELIVRVQEILKKTNNLESLCIMDNAYTVLNHRNLISRRIACCELEWLVLYSFLSTDEAALAYNLSFRSFKQPLRCFTFSDVQIEEGCFKFAPQERRSETTDNISTASATVQNERNDSPATEPQVGTILTPVLITQKMIHHLKHVLKQEEDLNEIAFCLWDLAFGPRSFSFEAIWSEAEYSDIVEELAGIVCAAPSERRIPLITGSSFIMDMFGYLVGKQVSKQERGQFLNELVIKWQFSPNFPFPSYLEVPQLLWKAYTATNTTSKRYELIDRVQEILKKTNNLKSLYITDNAYTVLDNQDFISRRIACCELEWLVLHSSLSTDEAALAYDLSFHSFKQPLRCFTFSDVQIEEGCFKFAPQERRSETTDNISTASATVGNAGNDFPATEPQVGTILAPVLIAQKMIHRLKCVLRQGEDLTEIAFSLWNVAFNSRSRFGCEAECAESLSFLDDYVDVFLSILAEASSTEIMLHWASVDSHHVHQCSEVVLKACKWSGGTEDIGKEGMLKFQAAVSTTLETIRKKTPLALDTFAPLPFIEFSVPCFRLLKPQLEHLSNMLESRLPIDVTTQVLNLFQTNVQAGATVADIVSSWSSRDQAMELVERVHAYCQEEEILFLNPAQSEFVWKLLNAFGRHCMNSCKDLMVKLKELILLYDPEDEHGFNRLPKWREVMLADGFSPHVINCWCEAFLMTPLEDLSSRDVDAITDLNSRSLQLVAPLSQKIKNCIFPEGGFQVTQKEGIREQSIKKRLRLARLLGEFINILKLRKPEENRKDAVIKRIVVEACNELCEAHESQNRRRKDLYKIHGQMLKALFIEVFGKQRKPDGDEDCRDVTRQTVDEESRGELPVARQSSYLHESLPSILSHNGVYEPLLVLLRRWLSQIAAKPTLALHTIEIVQLLFSVHSSVVDQDLLQRLHNIIKDRILSLEQNQVLIAQLQASGYNQNTQRTLWSSSKLECSGYLSKRESSDSRRFQKKLEQVLRSLWNEWKDILLMLGIASIKVGETDVCTKDLFGLQASLEEMEKQVSAVKESLNQIKSEDLERRTKQLIRLEQRHRARFDKLYKGRKVRNSHHQCTSIRF